MKKLLFLSVLMLSALPAFSKNVVAESLNSVNPQNETVDYNVKIIKDVTFSNGFILPKGAIVNMDIVKIVPARWGKRPAYIVVSPVFMEVPLSKEDLNPPYKEKNELYYAIESEVPYDDDFEWEELPEKEPRTTKYVMIDEQQISGRSTTIKFTNTAEIKQNLKQNWKKDLKKAGTAVGKRALTTMAPGSEQLYQISKGLIMPEEGKSRLQSAASNVIDDSPLKHIQKGAEINIKEGDVITFRMKAKGENTNKHLEKLNNLI